MNRLVPVLHSDDPVEIASARALLAEAGIESVVDNQRAPDLIGVGRIGGWNPLAGSGRLLVADEDAGIASKLLLGSESTIEEELPEELTSGEDKHAPLVSPTVSTLPSSERPRPHVATTSRPALVFEMVTVLAVSSLASYAAILADGVWGVHDASPTTFPEDQYWHVVVTLPKVLTVLFVILRLSSRREDFGLVFPRLADLAHGVALAIGALALHHAGVNVLTALGVEPRPHEYPMPSGHLQSVISLCGIGLTALAEELVFRCYLITRLFQLTRSVVLSIAASSVLFALGHAYQGTWGVIQALLLGLLMGSVFLAARRVWPLLLAHLLWNAMVLWKVLLWL